MSLSLFTSNPATKVARPVARNIRTGCAALAISCVLGVTGSPVFGQFVDNKDPAQKARALGSSAPLQQQNGRVISRAEYAQRMHGFWLGQSIANWSGLTTEMVRTQAPFYTDLDWGKRSEPSVWGHYAPHTSKIDFYLVPAGKVWGADDDTDIEYMYQHLLETNRTNILTAAQIREGWLKHIYANNDAPISPITFERENFLWVSNERARILMAEENLTAPDTSEPEHNEHSAMIDAQLTTEIFGLFAPTRPDVALKMAHLPIRTTAKNEAEWIAEFYVTMHALASSTDASLPLKDQTRRMAAQARTHLPDGSYPAAMYDFVRAAYDTNPDKQNWEQTRDAVYQRYQLTNHDGYSYNWPFDAGINFAASLVSLFYGEGDIKRTIQIGALSGWDSDNPTATWGGLLGFMIGKKGVELAFGTTDLADAYWIHRTRRGFPDHTPGDIGEDRFSLMAERALTVIDRVVQQEMNGSVDVTRDVWLIPSAASEK